MGAGASAQLADQVSKDEARAFAGERWNEQMDIKFDTMATKGCVAKAVIEEHMSSKELRIMDWNAIAETASKLTDVRWCRLRIMSMLPISPWPCRRGDRSLASSVA